MLVALFNAVKVESVPLNFTRFGKSAETGPHAGGRAEPRGELRIEVRGLRGSRRVAGFA
jgi:hypothetical protein